MKTLLALIALAGLVHLPTARAAQDCPDTCATQVQAKVEAGDENNQCFIGITIFGLEIGISVGHCPLMQVAYPAHQSCQGQYNEGTACAASGDLEVRLLKCECNLLGGRTLGIGLPGCDCKDSGNSGTVEDAKTTNCVPLATN